MRRITSIILILTFVVSLVSCGGGNAVFKALDKQEKIIKKALAAAMKGDKASVQALEKEYMALKKAESAAHAKAKKDQAFLDKYLKRVNKLAKIKSKLALEILKLKIPNNFY